MSDIAFNVKFQESKLCRAAYYYLHRIHSIRDCLTQHATELLAHSFVISRLEYGNSLLYGLPDQLLDKLQRVQNLPARQNIAIFIRVPTGFTQDMSHLHQYCDQTFYIAASTLRNDLPWSMRKYDSVHQFKRLQNPLIQNSFLPVNFGRHLILSVDWTF